MSRYMHLFHAHNPNTTLVENPFYNYNIFNYVPIAIFYYLIK
jgi:hypothetical protein